MNDEHDLHEPEHDHLLDPEFYEDEQGGEQEVQPLLDDDEDEDWYDDDID